MKRMRAEAATVAMPPTFAALTDAITLRTFAEEVLRWAPIINGQIGRAVTSFEVAGHRIPAGALLLAGFYADAHGLRVVRARTDLPAGDGRRWPL